ncbi:hypothetical protein ACRALDRAFT_1092918 [Sodiomyces alcalophilus JCM 7366]|uniref:uncharacterized protein n=1 Tax=Sodiomyces alcalophilus JCM 7366 TaxID=591952 RepID=UPI0039B505FF
MGGDFLVEWGDSEYVKGSAYFPELAPAREFVPRDDMPRSAKISWWARASQQMERSTAYVLLRLCTGYFVQTNSAVKTSRPLVNVGSQSFSTSLSPDALASRTLDAIPVDHPDELMRRHQVHLIDESRGNHMALTREEIIYSKISFARQLQTLEPLGRISSILSAQFSTFKTATSN